jgi:hypothetical protein
LATAEVSKLQLPFFPKNDLRHAVGKRNGRQGDDGDNQDALELFHGLEHRGGAAATRQNCRHVRLSLLSAFAGIRPPWY